MAGDGSDAAFGYHEPTIATLLNQTGLLLVLNIVNVCLDKVLYCGLIGQLFVGILWGTPGAKWLDRETETVIQQLGYIGLIMLVYEGKLIALSERERIILMLEGGLSTSIKSMRANFLVSLCVAFTGIGVPMGLSFILMDLVSASSLQAFAAGAALSATSLGTTFTILSTTKLIATRLGTVTASAAMLDDVVGLVMVQIISNLGGSTSSFSAVTVIRPIFVSIGFAMGLFILCAFCLKPILKRAFILSDNMPKFMGTMQFAFLAHTCVLVGIVAGATYAGTSSLFAAYLAGVVVSWFDGLAADFKASTSKASNNAESDSGVLDEQSSQGETRRRSRQRNTDSNAPPTTQQTLTNSKVPTGAIVYEKYYKEPISRILIPLFFVRSLPCPCYRVLTRRLGLYRILDSYHRDVSRKCCMAARHYLRFAHDPWEDGHWSMACSLFTKPDVQCDLRGQEPLFVSSLLFTRSRKRQEEKAEVSGETSSTYKPVCSWYRRRKTG